MKDISELNPHKFQTTLVIDANLKMLFERLLEFQDACDLEFTITSGLRDDALQAQLIHDGKSSARHSKHLAGLAADIEDKDGKLDDWVSKNLDVVARIGLWFECPLYTVGWVHAQCMAPASGKRVFIP